VTPRKLYNFYIDPDLAEGLKQLKESEHESEGAIVRRALRRYLEEKGVIVKSERKRARTRKRS
jgi:Ribbon-helix-helix protein, copG family